MPPALLLAGVALFQLKHFAADFLMQPGYVFRNKGRYGHPGGLLHAAIHLLGSAPILMLLGVHTLWIVVIIAGEGIVHYHIDWGKEWLGTTLGLDTSQWRYWALFGLDQFLHQLTYVAMLAVVAL